MSKSKKPSKAERRKRPEFAPPVEPGSLTPAQVVRRRRNRRMLFLLVVGVTLPVLEVLAYRFRSIMITVVNRSEAVVTNVKVNYPGGSFETKELKPGGELTQMARPIYTFNNNEFSTYRTVITFSTSDGGFIRQNGRTGTIDYSARETYTIQNDPANNAVGIKHTTAPGFPLSTIRDLLRRIGVG